MTSPSSDHPLNNSTYWKHYREGLDMLWALVLRTKQPGYGACIRIAYAAARKEWEDNHGYLRQNMTTTLRPEDV